MLSDGEILKCPEACGVGGLREEGEGGFGFLRGLKGIFCLSVSRRVGGPALGKPPADPGQGRPGI